MPKDKLVRTFPSADGMQRVELYLRDDGLFYFKEFTGFYDDGHLCFAEGFPSGLYNRDDEAEAEIRATTPWLRQISN
jgi:hypothetical protein